MDKIADKLTLAVLLAVDLTLFCDGCATVVRDYHFEDFVSSIYCIIN